MRSDIVGSSNKVHFSFDVARGLYPEVSSYYKFGANRQINTADATLATPQTLWEFGREFGNVDSEYIYLPFNGAADPINKLSSSDALDAGLPIEIQGLDFTGSFAIQTITLNATDGRVPVDLTTPLWRVFRMQNKHADLDTGQGRSASGTIYCFQGSSATTDGVPDTLSAVKAVIVDGTNKTLMCLFTIPLGYTGYLSSIELDMAKTQAATATIALRIRRFGQAFSREDTFFLSSSGTSDKVHDFSPFLVLPELTDIELSCIAVSANGVGFTGSFSVILGRN